MKIEAILHSANLRMHEAAASGDAHKAFGNFLRDVARESMNEYREGIGARVVAGQKESQKINVRPKGVKCEVKGNS